MIIPNLDNLILQHRSGKSLLQISKEANISRCALTQQFLHCGIKPRGRSDAAYIRFRDGAPCGNPANRIGSTNSLDHRCRIASAVMNNGTGGRGRRGGKEAETITILKTIDPRWIHQFAIDQYNVDIALPARRIAVELEAKPLTTEKHVAAAKRLKHLTDLGWSVLYILWRQETRRAIPRWNIIYDALAIREQVIAFMEVLSRNHAPRSCYRVIWGNGKRATVGRYDFQDIPRI